MRVAGTPVEKAFLSHKPTDIQNLSEHSTETAIFPSTRTDREIILQGDGHGFPFE